MSFLGDEIPKDDVAKLLDELCDKEEDDGMIPYIPFLERLWCKVFSECFLNFAAQSCQEWNIENHTVILLLVTELIKEFSNVILGNFIT